MVQIVLHNEIDRNEDFLMLEALQALHTVGVCLSPFCSVRCLD